MMKEISFIVRKDCDTVILIFLCSYHYLSSFDRILFDIYPQFDNLAVMSCHAMSYHVMSCNALYDTS